MSKRVLLAGAALVAAVGFGAWRLTSHWAAPGADELVPQPGDGLVTFARIQTEMNRAAAGRAALPADDNADPLEDIGHALREFLGGNTVKASSLLDDVDAELESRVPSDDQVAADPLLADKEEWLVSYFELLPEAPSGKGIKADTYIFNRLVATLRRVDAVLLSETMPKLKGYDLVARKAEGDPSVFDGMALRLPCRLVASHRANVDGAMTLMGPLAAGLTDCPVARGHEADMAQLDAIARNPAKALATATGGNGNGPRDLKTPLMSAAAKGRLDDISKAIEAGADPQRVDARGRTALYYLLGNGAITGEDRAKAVKLLF